MDKAAAQAALETLALEVDERQRPWLWYELLRRSLGLGAEECRMLPDGSMLGAEARGLLAEAGDLVRSLEELGGHAYVPSEGEVREWVRLFTARSEWIPPMYREARRRLIAWFATHRDVSWEEVWAATHWYLRSTEPRYVRRPHYFVRKKEGGVWISDLDGWVEKVRNQERQRGLSRGRVIL